MPSSKPKTTYLNLPLFVDNDDETTFNEYWKSINLNADGTTSDLSAFQLIDAAYHTLDTKIDEASAHTIREYNNKSAFPATGTANSIYIDKSTDAIYRWNGTAYVELNPTTDIEQAIAALQQTVAAMPDEIYDRVAQLLNDAMGGSY